MRLSLCTALLFIASTQIATVYARLPPIAALNADAFAIYKRINLPFRPASHVSPDGAPGLLPVPKEEGPAPKPPGAPKRPTGPSEEPGDPSSASLGLDNVPSAPNKVGKQFKYPTFETALGLLKEIVKGKQASDDSAGSSPLLAQERARRHAIFDKLYVLEKPEKVVLKQARFTDVGISIPEETSTYTKIRITRRGRPTTKKALAVASEEAMVLYLDLKNRLIVSDGSQTPVLEGGLQVSDLVEFTASADVVPKAVAKVLKIARAWGQYAVYNDITTGNFVSALQADPTLVDPDALTVVARTTFHGKASYEYRGRAVIREGHPYFEQMKSSPGLIDQARQRSNYGPGTRPVEYHVEFQLEGPQKARAFPETLQISSIVTVFLNAPVRSQRRRVRAQAYRS